MPVKHNMFKQFDATSWVTFLIINILFMSIENKQLKAFDDQISNSSISEQQFSIHFSFKKPSLLGCVRAFSLFHKAHCRYSGPPD